LELTAFCTMFLEGNIGAPPTVVVISPAAEGTGPAWLDASWHGAIQRKQLAVRIATSERNHEFLTV